MSETPETNMATSHKDPRSVAPLLATIADFARLQESCNAQDASVVAMSEKVRRLERQRDELAAVLREYGRRSHTYCEDSWYSCPKAEDGCADDRRGPECDCGADEHNAKIDALLARLGEGGEG